VFAPLVALLAGVVQIGLARPPAAYVDTGAARVPLAITSWCWDTHCGAPLGTAPRRVTVARRSRVRVELKLDAVRANVTIGGVPAKVSSRGREVSWDATRAGGLTAFVRYRRGWVVYSARLALR
jgi:hypothetical protein